MIYPIYPKKDSTIYEKIKNLNSGIDPILEITKTIEPSSSNNVVTDTTYSSRILMQFDYTDLDSLADIGFDSSDVNNKYILQLYSTEMKQLPTSFTLEVDTISGSWNMGLGKYDYDPYLTSGVSWKYRTSKEDGTEWTTASFDIGSTGSWISTPGGGTWYDNNILIATKSYEYNELKDIEIDISSIAYSHITSVVPNHGLLVRRTTSDEQSLNDEMDLKFFSIDTHTIYLPHIKVKWDDWSFNTGSLNQLSSGDNVIYFKNLKHTFTTNERVKLRLVGRPKFPKKTFSTSSAYSNEYYLPASSSYAIEDLHSKNIVVPHDDIYTRISCDSTGSYFNLWMDSLQPERWYKISIKSKYSDDDIRIYNKDYIFKLEREV